MQKTNLSQRQQRFVILLLEGATQIAAYKGAGYKVSSRKQGDTNASRLVRSEGVAAALALARSASVTRAGVTVDIILDRLEAARQLAMICDPPQAQAAVNAATAQAKLLGLMVEKTEAHVIHHKPALHQTKALELSEAEWRETFALPAPAKDPDIPSS